VLTLIGFGLLTLGGWLGGPDAPKLLEGVQFASLNPEAITFRETPEGAVDLFITSDDGSIRIGGKPCKQLKDPNQKGFRALRLPGGTTL
jgi:hypothetical protein